MADTKHDLQTVVDAIRGEGRWANPDGSPKTSGGVIVVVARRLQVTRQTVYGYLERWKTARQALDDERASMIDLAESKLFSEINAGNITAIIFTLKTIGKQRGYVERQEFDVRNIDEAIERELERVANRGEA